MPLRLCGGSFSDTLTRSMRILSLLAAVVMMTYGGAACSDPGDKEPVKENRLAKERSPYLRQHKTNPVDWYPWSDEALAKARDEDKPIFLSIGYAACHWCHVMEHESFEDGPTAELMNRVFVCVKVDREERPDLDRVYMNATQLFGRGGWPMTVLLLPDGRPFLGATYIPRERLKGLILEIERAWKDDRKKIVNQAAAIAERVEQVSDGPDIPDTGASDAEILKDMRNALGVAFDAVHGGYGTQPKFPPHTEFLFFLEDGARRATPDDKAQILKTLDAMEAGGIHDHVGGGFHRYSTDRAWLLPHFEKMLYDNALLAQAYAGAFAVTGKPSYRRTVERIFAWLEREMKQPGGGYASSLDADTQGEEGLTYTWTLNELRGALDAQELGFFLPLFRIEERGNFLDEATHRRSGRNIPHLEKPIAVQAKVDAVLGKLLAARDKRPQPGLDDKVITGWNGLLISAFARAGVDLSEPAYLDRARGLASFLLSKSRKDDGTLLRFPAGSGPEIPGFTEDHVHLIEGLLDLADATKETTWRDAARDLADRLNDEFQDQENGGFWTTSRERHETLFARTKETWDSPIPSDNGTAARLNLRLFAATGEKGYADAADRTLSAFRPLMAHPRMATGVMALLRALAMRRGMEQSGVAGATRGDAHARVDVAQVDAFLERMEAKLGSRVGLVVRVDLDAGWHVNANVPSNADLIATRLTTDEKSPAPLEDVLYPPARSRPLGGEAVALYEGTFEIRGQLAIPADVPAGPRKIPLVLTLQPCDESTCKAPLEIRLELHLRFADTDGEAQHPALFTK